MSSKDGSCNAVQVGLARRAARSAVGPPTVASATNEAKLSTGKTIVMDSRISRVTSLSEDRVNAISHNGSADRAFPNPFPVCTAEDTKGLMSVSRWR